MYSNKWDREKCSIYKFTHCSNPCVVIFVVFYIYLWLNRNIFLTTSKISNDKMILPKYIYNRASIPQSPTRRTAIIVFMVVAVYPTFVIPQGSTCPRKCQCIWRDSKITVDCSDKSLASIPTTVETNTQGKLNNSKYGKLTGLFMNECNLNWYRHN